MVADCVSGVFDLFFHLPLPHGAPHSPQTPWALVPAKMQRRGSSSGKVAKWASGLPWVANVQTFRALAPGGLVLV